jgi:hypothetical protein
MKPISALAFGALLAVSTHAASQTLYRCGNTYSQTPCAADAASARISAGAAPEAAAGMSGSELCSSQGVAQMGFPDPASTRIRTATRAGTEVIQYAGKPIASRKFNVVLNTKNEVGAYTGERVYACYLSEDERRVLKVESPRQ